MYNATGPEAPLTMGEIRWVTEEFLAAQGVAPWTELPPSEPDAIGFESVSIRKALAAGLSLRPLRDTVRDTLAWDRSRPADAPRRAGISAAREQELLSAWHAAAASQPRARGPLNGRHGSTAGLFGPTPYAPPEPRGRPTSSTAFFTPSSSFWFLRERLP